MTAAATAPKVPKIPGDDDALPASRAPVETLNNAGRGTANDAGLEHERRVQGMAMAAAVASGKQPDLAAIAALGETVEVGATSIKRTRIINGMEVEVEVPIHRRNDHVQRFGVESKLPKGTPVNKDGTLFEGAGEAYGVIGDINLPEGKLVNRIIPLADEVPAKPASKK